MALTDVTVRSRPIDHSWPPQSTGSAAGAIPGEVPRSRADKYSDAFASLPPAHQPLLLHSMNALASLAW